MLVCAVDGEAVGIYERQALERTIGLLGEVPPGLRVGDGTWTARDVAAHLVTVIGRYLDPGVTLARSAREVDEINRRQLAELAEFSVDELVVQLRTKAELYAQFWTLLPLDQQLPFHSGVSVDVAALRSNWIGELLIHGRDVAIAADREWPIEDSVGLLLVRLLLQVLPGYLRADQTGSAVLVIEPTGGQPAIIRVEAGATSVLVGDDTAADRLSGAPTTLALLLYSRLDLDQAHDAGVLTTGDPTTAQRIFRNLEQP